MATFEPTLGATCHGWGTTFRVWAPEAQHVEVVLEGSGREPAIHSMNRSRDGFFHAMVTGVPAGAFYRYRIDGKGPYPDPASRFQPKGVHGVSEVVDPGAFRWTDQNWTGIEMKDLILYELHVGTFTREGTFISAAAKLPLLRDLGVTAVELMPVADFAGNRNWGYDGVAPFAPARCYGRPDDLRFLINAAHGLGLAVHLDVVYNHLGPDGAYQGSFSPHYYSSRSSPWGQGINFDGPHSPPVRDYFIENALRWIHEYHIDGLRLDATHAIHDESPRARARTIVAAIASAVRSSLRGSARRVQVIAEDNRNLANMLAPESAAGWALDAVWSDDFHHQIRRSLAGDSDGYFQDFDGSAGSIAATARQGWFYTGQYSPYFGRHRGTSSDGIERSHFVFFIQNHDQVGNRAFGDRLNHSIPLPAYRAATVLLLLLPETPLLFMGQEWAASSPFQFFTDHNVELGRLVTEGRRREFSRFAAFTTATSRSLIPDPQDPQTFEASRLDWREREREPHASILRLYRKLLGLRRADITPEAPDFEGHFQIEAGGEDVLILRGGNAKPVMAVIRLRGSGPVGLRAHPFASTQPGFVWETVLTTEDPEFAQDPSPIVIQEPGQQIEFHRPGAAVFRAHKVV